MALPLLIPNLPVQTAVHSLPHCGVVTERVKQCAMLAVSRTSFVVNTLLVSPCFSVLPLVCHVDTECRRGNHHHVLASSTPIRRVPSAACLSRGSCPLRRPKRCCLSFFVIGIIFVPLLDFYSRNRNTITDAFPFHLATRQQPFRPCTHRCLCALIADLLRLVIHNACLMLWITVARPVLETQKHASSPFTRQVISSCSSDPPGRDNRLERSKFQRKRTNVS